MAPSGPWNYTKAAERGELLELGDLDDGTRVHHTTLPPPGCLKKSVMKLLFMLRY